MRSKTISATLLLVSVLLAQQPNPTCRHCSASYIPKSELDAYIQRAIEHRLIDQQVRSIDVGKSQVGIGIVRRGRLTGTNPEAETVAEHEQISEVYYIIDGSATLLTGPDLVEPKKRPDNLKTVREQNGPGYNARSIAHPMITELKPGDMIVIPAGTGHWFTKIDDHITYAMVRIDPDKVVPTKNETQSRDYLKNR
ncbi:MAG TPA: hypothetical protein VMB85_05230 [Bryobacteraceae bacterium]|nr:hypothetical protein [Bryobacteraceae bacterium]